MKWQLLLLCLASSLAAAKPYRIGYFETKERFIYMQTLDALKQGLAKRGWLQKLVFPPDVYISNPAEAEGEEMAKALLLRQDLDLVLVFGTTANQLMVKANKTLLDKQTVESLPPILGVQVNQPVKSGLVVSEQDSGIDNYTVYIEPTAFYEQMLKLFHDEVGFHKLGLLYRKGEEETSTHLDEAYNVATSRNFNIVEAELKYEDSATCLRGLKKLLTEGMDAFLVPSLLCFDWSHSEVSQLFNLLLSHKIPIFSEHIPTDVKAGALMGMSNESTKGEVLAERVIRMLQGTAPRTLPMLMEAPIKVVLNLAVARKIGFEPSFDILGACDEIYENITLPQ